MKTPDASRASRGPARRIARNIGVIVVLSTMTLATWHVVSPRSSPINLLLTAEALPAVPRARRPTTLSPDLFSGRVAAAYRVAIEHPEILERLPCYCGCYLTHGHQNSLDCFQDRHSESCEMCLKIALQADEMAKQGYGAEDIKIVIDRQFAPRKF